ncbi:MAG: hypothetical protein MMC33_007826 [Icmadophila ericetorum]|nr:hypothetical protein [Icmadophila ericetorum]
MSAPEEITNMLLNAGCETDLIIFNDHDSLGYITNVVSESTINLMLNHNASLIDRASMRRYLINFVWLQPLRSEFHFNMLHMQSREFQTLRKQFEIDYSPLEYNFLLSVAPIFFALRRSEFAFQDATAYLSMLLRDGCNPCAFSGRYGHTPTLLAIWYNVLPMWFTTLRDNQFDISGIVRHCLANYPGRLPEMGFYLDIQGIRQKHGSLEAFRAIILSEFAKNGCYITDPGDSAILEPPETDLNTSRIDYAAPSGEAREKGVRRRMGTARVVGRTQRLEE